VRKGPPLTAPEPEAEGSPHDKKCFHGVSGGTKIQGCILGLAIGDALGYPTEFMSLSQMHRQDRSDQSEQMR